MGSNISFLICPLWWIACRWEASQMCLHFVQILWSNSLMSWLPNIIIPFSGHYLILYMARTLQSPLKLGHFLSYSQDTLKLGHFLSYNQDTSITSEIRAPLMARTLQSPLKLSYGQDTSITPEIILWPGHFNHL